MRPLLARLLTRLYPRKWRRRYGSEFSAMLEEGGGGFHALLNVVWGGMREYFRSLRGGSMESNPNSFGAVLKHPSAFLPVAMSGIALTMVLSVLALHGVPHDTDEGAVAHLWQLLMAGQVPIIGLFAIKWLPRAARATVSILALQIAAALASMAPVFLLNL